jgi:phosphoglycolate phosphatase
MSRLLIFDWDGTVVDSTSHIVESINKATLNTLDKLYSDKEVKRVIGFSLPQAFLNLTGNVSQDAYEKFARDYKKYYAINRPKPFNSIELGFGRLVNNDYTLAVATGKSRKGLENDFSAFNLSKYFQASVTADECLSKPNSQMIDNLCTSLMFDKENTIMIGDSLLDQDMARNATVDFIGVSYGTSLKKEFKDNILYCAESPINLFDWIIKNK